MPRVNRRLPHWLTPPGLLARLHEWLLPPTCLLCGGPGQPGPLDLCPGCEGELPPPPPAPPAAGQFELYCCPHAYAWPVDLGVRALKFHGDRSHGRLLGELLGRARLAMGPPWPVLVVPVPLHPARLVARGYNQAAELARHAARRTGIALAPRVLQRVRPTQPQSGLGAAGRTANVAGAFVAQGSFAGMRIALVDDVVTTGSTAAAAAVALRAAGAGPVELWAAAAARRLSAAARSR